MKSVIIPEIGTECKICGKKYNYTSTLSPHVKSHGISLCEYYETYINPNEDIKCPYCGNDRKINSRWWWRQSTCGSEECRRAHNSHVNKEMWSDEEFRESQTMKFKAFWNSEEGRKQASLNTSQRFKDGNPSAYNGVKAMRKSLFEDSNFDVNKFKSLRIKIRNSYVTFRGENSYTDLYLVEFEDGLIKVGITKSLSTRFKEVKVKVLDCINLPTPISANLEVELLVKYFDYLVDREGRTKSEFIDSSQKENLINDFIEIRKGI